MTQRTYPHQPDYGAPPGYVLEDYLEAWGFTCAEFARRHSLPTDLIEGIVAGSAPLSTELAAIFDEEFGLEASIWLSIEADYRYRLEQTTAAVGSTHLGRVETMTIPTVKRIVCLANSRMRGKRCIAGKEVFPDGRFGRWIRPVNSEDYQGLPRRELQYIDGTELQVLDILDVRVLQPLPKDHQRENWMLDMPSPWTKAGVATAIDLAGMTDNKATLWVNNYSTINGQNDQVPSALVNQVDSSLVLIKVDDLELSVYQDYRNYRLVRGTFWYEGANYTLSVTDPNYYQEYRSKPEGNYRVGSCFLTVSLGGLFGGDAYKLIAAIIKP